MRHAKCRSRVRRTLQLAAGCALVTGCAVGPDFVRPVALPEEGYGRAPLTAPTAGATGPSQRIDPDLPVSATWWELFGSESLNVVVRQALAGNPTLHAAEAHLRASQDYLRAGYGVFFPRVDAAASMTRLRNSPAQQDVATSASVYNLVSLSTTVSYPLDVFGGQRRTVEALAADVDGQRFATAASFLTLTTNVVATSIARAAYQAELKATTETIELEIQELRATEAQVNAGTQPYSSVLSLRSLRATTEAELAPLRQKISQAEHLLAALEGVAPSAVLLPDIEFDALALPADLPLSIPSALIRQRPDVLSAEALLHRASASVGVATAAMLPSISLTAEYGAAGSGFGRLSAPGSRFWNVGPSLSIPVFQGGRLWFTRKAALEEFRAAQSNYRQTVLGAFAQVADVLAALEHDAETVKARNEAQQYAADALRLLRTGYDAGLVGYLDVLIGDAQLHQARITWLEATAQREQDTVALYAAIGGGWWRSDRLAGDGAGH